MGDGSRHVSYADAGVDVVRVLHSARDIDSDLFAGGV